MAGIYSNLLTQPIAPKYEEVPKILKVQFEDAFQRMSYDIHSTQLPPQHQPSQPSSMIAANNSSNIADITTSSSATSKMKEKEKKLGGPNAASSCPSVVPVINLDQLPHMLRILNLAINASDELPHLVEKYGIPTTTTATNANSNKPVVAHSIDGQQTQTTQYSDAAEEANPSSVIVFTFQRLVEVYNAFAPLQSQFIQGYMAFFNFLDHQEQGYISLADLRHALCNLGDPLTDKEFNHMLYVCNLLHRSTLSIFEFMVLVMGVSSEECEAVLKIPPGEQEKKKQVPNQE